MGSRELGKTGLRGRMKVFADRDHLIWVMPAQGHDEFYGRRWYVPAAFRFVNEEGGNG